MTEWDFNAETSDTSIFNDEKAEWLEKQVEERLKFGLESREVLIKESHTTLNWLMAIVATPAAFIASNVMSPTVNWPVCLALSIPVVAAAIMAIYLVKHALQAVDTYGLETFPRTLFSSRL